MKMDKPKGLDAKQKRRHSASNALHEKKKKFFRPAHPEKNLGLVARPQQVCFSMLRP